MRVFFATFSPWVNGVRLPTNGSVEPMIHFAKKTFEEFVLLDQPIPMSDFLLPRYELYERKKKMVLIQSPWYLRLLLPILTVTNKPKTQVSFKIRDFLSVLIWPSTHKSYYDVFIGLESINAIAGIVLRYFGRVKTVVYYVSDYSPNRYKNNIFNRVYLWLDRIASTHADYIWDVSKAMQPARILAGLDPKKSAPVIHVPNGLYPSQISVAPLSTIDPYALVYLGTLGKENGPELLIEAMPKILRIFSKATLHVIGGNQVDISKLRQLATSLGVQDHVTFHGFVMRSSDATRILNRCSLALAPYRAISGSPRFYADAGKIRIYCGAGVPVVTTRVPPIGEDAKNVGAAVIVPDTADGFSHVIIEILSDRNRYLLMRRSAIQFAKDSTWTKTFSSAFKIMSC